MITNLILSLGLSFAVGLNGIKENHNNYVEDNPLNVVFNDTNYHITINTNELNNYTFENLFNVFFNYDSGANEYLYNDYEFSLSYNNKTYLYNDNMLANYPDVQWRYADNDFIYFNTLGNYTFSYQTNNIIPFEHDLTLFLEDDTQYNTFKNAIELDIQANTTQTNMGNSIISAIVSGLGLISNLASEFLTGFSTLFWNANNSTLTSFGTFALVMLGVAITMAVISLVLNLIRGNTGA